MAHYTSSAKSGLVLFPPEITQPDDAGVSLDKNLSGPGSLAH
jgi:hypothetical protein